MPDEKKIDNDRSDSMWFIHIIEEECEWPWQIMKSYKPIHVFITTERNRKID